MKRVLCLVLPVLFCAAALDAATTAEKRAALRTPVVEAVDSATPAVVNIATEKIVTMRVPEARSPVLDDELLDKFFDRYHPQNVRLRSLGSGVVIDPRGYIVTNEHVVRRASKITVTLKDKSSYDGKLISADPSRDLAVVKIARAAPFPAARMGRLEPLRVGETAIAVGNPFGFEHTVTVGVVSAVGRSVRQDAQTSIQNLLQTDASINPGNSGGALLDINGDLIGINTAIKAGAEGIGFAIPIDEVRKALVDLLDFRRLSRVSIGVGLVGLQNTETGEPAGMRVIQIQPDSPADKGGLRLGDIITALNGRRCVEVLAFEIDVMEHASGDKLVFEGLRAGQPFRAEVTLASVAMPDSNAIVARRLGMTVAKIEAPDATRLGVDAGGGLIVRSVGKDGPAAASGLAKDDVILLFANFRVNEPEELASGLERVRPGDSVVLVLLRKGFKYYTWIKVN